MPHTRSLTDAVTDSDLGQCRAYLGYQLNHPKRPSEKGIWPPPGPAITISAQTGAGAEEVMRQLAPVLQDLEPKDRAPWTVFDRLLVEQVLEEHHLPKNLADFMPEDRRSYLGDVVEEMIGLRPPSWELIPKVIKTVRHLAYEGHVIVVGRAASLATGGMQNVFHVRLIAPLSRRTKRVQTLQNLSPKEAAKLIARTDRARKRYAKAYFHANVDDDLQYHLVLNTNLVTPRKAAEIIASAARICFESFTGTEEPRVLDYAA